MVWSAGAVLTAAQLNTYLPQTWTPYGTPSTILTASTANPTLGTDSSATASYIQFGKLVHFKIAVVCGSTGTASGSGTYQFLLPVTPVAGTIAPLGQGVTQDGVGAAATACSLLWASGTIGHLYLSGFGPSTDVTNNVTVNRRYLISGTYEAA